MKNFTPTNKIPSAMASIERAGAVKVQKRVGWEMQRRVPAEVMQSILATRRAKALKGLAGY